MVEVVPSWVPLCIASLGGFVLGMQVMLAWTSRVTIRIGSKIVQLKRWAAATGAVAASTSIIVLSFHAWKVPTVTNNTVAAVIIVLFGLSGLGVVNRRDK